MLFREYLKNHFVVLDGGMGTLLQEKGLMPGEMPETWNLTHPEVIREIHKAYFDAGSNVVSTNTFGANLLKFSEEELQDVIQSAVENARWAKNATKSEKETFIALDIGPTGRLLKPLGDLDFEEAVRVFRKTAEIGAKCGVDLVLIETMNDCYETKAALLGVKEGCDIPVLVSNAYGEDGKLMTGATPAAMVAMLEGMGADAVGANCSLGPKELFPVVNELLACASVPVLFKPNAGLPQEENGRAVYNVFPEEFARDVAEQVKAGVRLAGGCCGTTPDYIRRLNEETASLSLLPLTEKNRTVASSYTHAVLFGHDPVLIGERINPTGKKRLKEALLSGDMDYILTEGVRQQEKGAHILDVNVGLPEICEKEMLCRAVTELQAVLDLPLQIDTASPEAMENAMRLYNGKAVINSVNGKEESMKAVFPLVKKYGGVVIALTLDENGIPDTAEGRVRIAKKILDTAKRYGLKEKDLVFDTLAMTISANDRAALATLSALRAIREDLGCHTSLGVSNISFGLPQRDAINGVFFAMALQSGLSAAIMNPHSGEMMKTYYAFRALSGRDASCADYIANADTFSTLEQNTQSGTSSPSPDKDASDLQKAVIRGLKEKAAEITKEKLKSASPLDLINDEIIPALNIVGEGFEQKKIYLPQLLMSAEAAKSAFEVVKHALGSSGSQVKKGTFVLATVKGDIHDIGKNIVKLLLENYGFDVIDLGKDVSPETIVEKVIETHSYLLGLSALMTTTVPAMQETIRLVREKAPWCRTIVGGAVLTQEYAEKIGADHYSKDALGSVRFGEEVLKEIQE